MKKLIVFTLTTIILAGCATNGILINSKTADKNRSISYYSSDITVPVDKVGPDQEFMFNLSFSEDQMIPNWEFCLKHPDNKIQNPILMFVIDDEIYQYNVCLIEKGKISLGIKGTSNQCLNYRFPIDAELFKAIMFGKDISILLTWNGQKFESILSHEIKSDFSLFYNYIRRNVIENKTLVLKA